MAASAVDGSMVIALPKTDVDAAASAPPHRIAPMATLSAALQPLHHRVLVAGSRTRPPLLLLHGFTGDLRSWQGFALAWRRGEAAGAVGAGGAEGAVAAEGTVDAVHAVGADRRRQGVGRRTVPRRRVIALDLPGHGRSPQATDPAARAMPGIVSAVLGTMDALDIARAHVLGYSMGGRVALSLALAAPERLAGLGLIGASPGIADLAERAARAAADDALAARLEREGLPAFVDHWMAQPLFASQARLDPKLLAGERRRRLEQSPSALAESLRRLGTGRMPPLWDRLETLAMPCLFLAGAEDARFLSIGRAMAERSGRITVRPVPGAGHAAQLEQPDWVADCVRSFLEAFDT